MGETVLLVPVTVPTPWLMLRLVAPVTVQERVLLWPELMVVGLAEKLVMVGAPAGVMFTVAVAVVFPDALDAVSVYVVDSVGETATLVPVTAPTPWLMLRLVAPLTDQERVLLCPEVMLAGFAVKLVMVGAADADVTERVTVLELT